MSTIDQLRDFISEELVLPDDPADLTPDYPLIDKGVLDSLGIFRVVAFLEEEWDIQVDDEDLIADNFRSLQSIAKLVEAKKGAP